jgi:hypothetical protein
VIDPFKEDLGRYVIAEEYVGAPTERGVITSFNPDYVFVQPDGKAYAIPFPREQLYYEEEFVARYS